MRELTHIPPPAGLRTPPLSYAVRTGDLLYISGIGPLEADNSVPVGFATQMQLVLATLDKVLAQAGADRSRLVKVNVLLTREEDVKEMNRLYAAWYGPGPYPARTTAVVKALPLPEFLLEIEAVAALG